MIEEPTVGMRVRFTGTSDREQIRIGDTGVIIRVDPGSSHKVQMDKEDDWHFVYPKDLTEIKENGMYFHEAVKQAGEKGRIQHETWGKWYTVTETMELYSRVGTNGSGIREISSRGWRVEVKTKEVTMEDLEEKYGCKVKVVK